MDEPPLEGELEFVLLFGELYVGLGVGWNTYAEGMFVLARKWMVFIGLGWPVIELRYIQHQ